MSGHPEMMHEKEANVDDSGYSKLLGTGISLKQADTIRPESCAGINRMLRSGAIETPP